MADFDHVAIDRKWQDLWESQRTFAAGQPGQKKFYCLDMFPYPSGSGLHVGHPLGYTATDIVSRYKRMQGFSVLHPMGFDAFGLPAEQHAVSTGEHPSLITRQNCETFTKQLKMVGLSYDWDRNLATCTEDYYHWTQWIFLKLYNSWFDDEQKRARPISELPLPDSISSAGAKAIETYRSEFRLAYYADAMVNWCPALGTVLANEEVIDGKSERGGHDVLRKPMKQWLLRITKYSDRLLSELEPIDWPESIKEQQRNWIGKKLGAEIHFAIEGVKDHLIAFTTRPDTLFGVTFFVISPEHSLVSKVTTPDQAAAVTAYCDEAKKLSDLARTIENRKKTGVFSGTYVINPINQERVPLYIGDYVLMSVGTGAVMGVPAHDERDFEFAQTFKLEVRPVISPTNEPAETREAIIRGSRAWTEAGSMLPSSALVARELRIEGLPNVEAGRKIVEWLTAHSAGNPTVTYKLRDWLFSRQRYWGEPIPIIHWDDGTSSALSEAELPLVLPEVADYKPYDGGESPLAKATEWLKVTDPKTGRTGRRETNTMPQWAGSCWYYLRFIDPKNSSAPWDPTLEKNWMPVDLYVGGAEHAVLHLLYARFWHKVLFDLGYVSTKEPFQKLYNQGMVLANAYRDSRGALVPTDQVVEGEDGVARHGTTGETLERIIAKMSKSLRNVVTLDEIVQRYGADTFRMYLMFMGPLDMSRVWDSRAIVGVHRFLRRVWTWATGDQSGPASISPPAVAVSTIRTTVEDGKEPEATKKALNRLIKKLGDDIEAMSFNTCISTMMEFLNAVQDSQISAHTLRTFVLVLSPFAPHMAEELWQRMGHARTLAYEAWPAYDERYLRDSVVTVVVQINGKKRALLEVPAEISEASLKAIVLERMASTEHQVKDSDQFFTVRHPATGAPKLVNVVKC